jgi:hypothetical protein
MAAFLRHVGFPSLPSLYIGSDDMDGCRLEQAHINRHVQSYHRNEERGNVEERESTTKERIT